MRLTRCTTCFSLGSFARAKASCSLLHECTSEGSFSAGARSKLSAEGTSGQLGTHDRPRRSPPTRLLSPFGVAATRGQTLVGISDHYDRKHGNDYYLPTTPGREHHYRSPSSQKKCRDLGRRGLRSLCALTRISWCVALSPSREGIRNHLHST